MGIIFTESFQRFNTGTFDVAGAGPVRPIQTDPEWREIAGYSNIADTLNGAYNTSVTYATIGIYADPVISYKKRLGLNIDPPTSTHNYNVDYVLERVFPAPKTKYVTGFLVRIPAGATMTANPSTVYAEGYGFEFCAAGRARLGLTTTQQPMYALVGGNGISGQSAFGADSWGRPTVAWGSMNSAQSSLNNGVTFRMKGVTDPNGAGIKLQYDTDHFFECEIDTAAQTIKVWVDDVYAGQATWNATYDAPFANGFQIRIFRGSSTAQGWTIQNGGVYISDIYCVDMNDGQVPNTRLGKTTRVMGESPDTDVSIQFTRPDGFPSNADVINDPIVNNATPTQFLSGDGAGAEDMYRTANSMVTNFAGSVYGVTLRARYANASGSSHTLAITTDDGVKTENSLGNVAAGSGVLMKSIVLNKTPSGTTWTPAKAAALKYGFKIVN